MQHLQEAYYNILAAFAITKSNSVYYILAERSREQHWHMMLIFIIYACYMEDLIDFRGRPMAFTIVLNP